jgi:phosphoribosylaminoimidazole-succinocarboxamide synthase
VERIGWSKTPPAPSLPPEVIAQTRSRYLQAYAMVTGTELALD